MNRIFGFSFPRFAVLVVGLVAFLPGEVRATAFTWLGMTNNNWAVSVGNWSGGFSFPGDFSSTTDTAQFDVLGNKYVILDYPVTVAGISYTYLGYTLRVENSLATTGGLTATTANAPILSLGLLGTFKFDGTSSVASLSGEGTVSNIGSTPAELNIVGNSGTTFTGRLMENSAPLSVTIGDGVNGASQTFSGSAGYSGTTLVQAQATLTSGANDALSVSSAHVVNGALVLATGSSTIGGLSGTGTVNLGGNGLTVVGGGDFEGSITGTFGTLTKAGGGTLKLLGSSDYTGPTFVATGTLQVDGVMTSNVTVRNGATLAGDGVVGDIVLESGAVLLPIDCMDGETLTWQSGASMLYTLGDDTAILQLNGDFVKSGLLDFDFTLEGYGTVDQAYTLITFSGTTTFEVGDFSYTAGEGLEGFFTLDENVLTFTVTAVPEPSTVVLGVAGMAVVLVGRRRGKC